MTEVGSAQRNLALSIGRCPSIDDALADPEHSCRAVVTSQNDLGAGWQVPEGWAGNLESARIVFLSSNPSIAESKPGQEHLAEAYPRREDPDAAIVDFVCRRFPEHASVEGRYRRVDGGWSSPPVRFWSRTRGVATAILGRPASPVEDYVMTEIVHCKSKGETGVDSAAGLCAATHVPAIFARTTAPLVVVLGQKALKRIRPLWQLPEEFGLGGGAGGGPVVRAIGGRPRVVAYLRHPSAHGPTPTLEAAYPAFGDVFRALCAGETVPEAFSTT